MPWTDAARVIDVSHWQPPDDLDWKAAAAAGCVGAIVKFTQGAGGVDPAARQHSRNAHQAGIPLIGGYHFGDGSDPNTQAKHFLATMRAEYGDDALTDRIVMLDAEQNKPQMTVRQAEIFVSAIRADLGRWPLLYMGHFGPTGNGDGLPSVVLSHCPLMLPAYGNHANNLGQYLPKGWRMPKDGADRGEPGMGVVRLWQFTDGSINGGPFPGLGKIDQSRLIGFGSLDEAQAALSLAGEPQAPLPITEPAPVNDKQPPVAPAAQHATLRQGDRGDAVAGLQKRLAALGFNVDVDGDFGPETLLAVVAFQKAHGLVTDGIAGPATFAALTQAAP